MTKRKENPQTGGRPPIPDITLRQFFRHWEHYNDASPRPRGMTAATYADAFMDHEREWMRGRISPSNYGSLRNILSKGREARGKRESRRRASAAYYREAILFAFRLANPELK